ncbi:hypothetical protein VH86_24605, partial [Pantoea sp. BL1]
SCHVYQTVIVWHIRTKLPALSTIFFKDMTADTNCRLAESKMRARWIPALATSAICARLCAGNGA